MSKKSQKVSYCVPSITSDQVFNILSKISLRKAVGVDGINARVLRVAAPVIAPTIAKMINYSFATGIYPQRWKTAKVIPLYKSGNVEDLFNYRPIPVLTILSKVIERHMYDTLYGYLSTNDLIYPRQSGFRQKHSTETALIKIIDELLFNLDKNQVSGMVLVDYCKAFDMVDHELLLDKLKIYGVENNAITWFKSYLVNRHQYVSISGKMSGMALMKHGVLQGSIKVYYKVQSKYHCTFVSLLSCL